MNNGLSTMPQIIHCPNCTQAMQVPDGSAGKQVRCPKCGGHLKAETYHEIQIERCPDCLGVWFDAGEAETLLRAETGNFGSIFKALVRGVHIHGKTPHPA